MDGGTGGRSRRRPPHELLRHVPDGVDDPAPPRGGGEEGSADVVASAVGSGGGVGAPEGRDAGEAPVVVRQLPPP